MLEQINSYTTLGITKSYRKVSSMLWLFSVALTTVIGPWLMKLSWPEIITSGAIYSVLAVFCFRGHRWAFVLSLILWTVEKGFSAYQGLTASSSSGAGGQLVTGVIWWAIYMGTFWRALAVENARREPPMSAIAVS